MNSLMQLSKLLRLYSVKDNHLGDVTKLKRNSDACRMKFSHPNWPVRCRSVPMFLKMLGKYIV